MLDSDWFVLSAAAAPLDNNYRLRITHWRYFIMRRLYSHYWGVCGAILRGLKKYSQSRLTEARSHAAGITHWRYFVMRKLYSYYWGACGGVLRAAKTYSKHRLPRSLEHEPDADDDGHAFIVIP